MPGSLTDGTVVENHGALFDVVVNGRVVRCLLRGKLKKDKQRRAAPLAAGDRVKIAMLEPGRGVIEQILPRESGFSRTAAGTRPLQHTLVANLDQAVIVFAAAEPRADLFMLDRFLVVAAASELGHVICINKCDLVDGGPLRARFAVYHQCGFQVLYTSAADRTGIEELRDVLRDRRSVLCGPSGVGKSSLLNVVAPGLRIRTADVGEVTHKGRHTTTSIQLHELPFGGWVADTAGLRQFHFVETCRGECPCGLYASRIEECPIKQDPRSAVEREHVYIAFPDIAELVSGCRYRDCSHRDEPGCAVRRAAAAGRVDRRRLKSFLQMAGR